MIQIGSRSAWPLFTFFAEVTWFLRSVLLALQCSSY